MLRGIVGFPTELHGTAITISDGEKGQSTGGILPLRLNGTVLADPRVETIIDDGRHYLKIGSRTYDIICSDVFTPWNEGTAYLYTVDHFRNIPAGLVDVQAKFGYSGIEALRNRP